MLLDIRPDDRGVTVVNDLQIERVGRHASRVPSNCKSVDVRKRGGRSVVATDFCGLTPDVSPPRLHDAITHSMYPKTVSESPLAAHSYTRELAGRPC